MSEAFLMRRGGSTASKAYALIAVSYPVGSACTAVKGTKTLTAKSGNGAYCFSIPEAGTWAVTITDGVNSVTRSVVISASGQVEKLDMRYEQILFDGGTGAEDWSAAPANYASVGNTIHLNGYHGDIIGGSVRAYGYLTDAISLAGMQTLEITADASYVTGYMNPAGHAQVRVVESGSAYSGTPAAAADLAWGSGEVTTLDISGLDASKTYRIAVYAAGGIVDEGGGSVADTLDVTVDASRVRVT